MNIYLELIFTFFRIGCCTFGGGMAILPMLQRELVEKKGWATELEVADSFAIAQCTPGIIAVNSAVYIGQKKAGKLGGICSALGVTLPSILIIGIIAGILRQVAAIDWVGHAFAGIRACVCVIILRSAVQMGKSAIIDWGSAVIFAVVLICSAFMGLSPILLVLLAGVCGFALRRGRERKS